MKTILCIDLGTKTGWAISHKRRISSGTVDFKNDRFQGGGMRYLKFHRWLDEVLHNVSQIDEVYFEEVRARQPSVAADHTYGGFLAMLTSWCQSKDIPYDGIPVGTIKKHTTGKGNANKEMMMKAIKDQGYEPGDDNEADALALLLMKVNS